VFLNGFAVSRMPLGTPKIGDEDDLRAETSSVKFGEGISSMK